MEAIWPGSGSNVINNTPFGLYDNDVEFQTDAPKFASWCAKRLGYPIMSIEMQDQQFYACFEEAISEYSSQVNSFKYSFKKCVYRPLLRLACCLNPMRVQ